LSKTSKATDSFDKVSDKVSITNLEDKLWANDGLTPARPLTYKQNLLEKIKN